MYSLSAASVAIGTCVMCQRVITGGSFYGLATTGFEPHCI